VLKIVEFNGGTSFENSEVNIILLDKIQEHERVVQFLVEMQLNNIERSKPREFLRAILDTETLQKVL